MNEEFLTSWLTSLSVAKRGRILNQVAYELTISARHWYVPGAEATTPEGANKLPGLNELQHQLLAQAGHYLDNEEVKVYPLDVFSKVVLQMAAHYGIASDLTTAIRYVQQKSSRPVSEEGRRGSETPDPL
jgi:hypothetical protein